MPDKNNGFQQVVDRLLMALDLPSELQLALALGLKQSTWSTRKTRNSLPREAIDSLIEREDLNPEFIYLGTGSVHIPVDGQAWGEAFQKALAAVLKRDEGWLVREGYQKKELKAIATGKATLTPAEAWRLVRDLRQVCKVDLNTFFCDEPASGLNGDESALVEAYRKVDKTGKTFILHAAGLAANVNKG